jgi:hypothetical protein
MSEQNKRQAEDDLRYLYDDWMEENVAVDGEDNQDINMNGQAGEKTLTRDNARAVRSLRNLYEDYSLPGGLRDRNVAKIGEGSSGVPYKVERRSDVRDGQNIGQVEWPKVTPRTGVFQRDVNASRLHTSQEQPRKSLLQGEN